MVRPSHWSYIVQNQEERLRQWHHSPCSKTRTKAKCYLTLNKTKYWTNWNANLTDYTCWKVRESPHWPQFILRGTWMRVPSFTVIYLEDISQDNWKRWPAGGAGSSSGDREACCWGASGWTKSGPQNNRQTFYRQCGKWKIISSVFKLRLHFLNTRCVSCQLWFSCFGSAHFLVGVRVFWYGFKLLSTNL